jgi:hypothetical protein
LFSCNVFCCCYQWSCKDDGFPDYATHDGLEEEEEEEEVKDENQWCCSCFSSKSSPQEEMVVSQSNHHSVDQIHDQGFVVHRVSTFAY